MRLGSRVPRPSEMLEAVPEATRWPLASRSEPEARRSRAPEARSPPSPAWSRPPASSSAPSPALAEPSPSRPAGGRGFAEAAADLGDGARGLPQSGPEAGELGGREEPPGCRSAPSERSGRAAAAIAAGPITSSTPESAGDATLGGGEEGEARARGERPVVGGEGEDEGGLPAGADRVGDRFGVLRAPSWRRRARRPRASRCRRRGRAPRAAAAARRSRPWRRPGGAGRMRRRRRRGSGRRRGGSDRSGRR